jgi:hypothetical protein
MRNDTHEHLVTLGNFDAPFPFQLTIGAAIEVPVLRKVIECFGRTAVLSRSSTAPIIFMFVPVSLRSFAGKNKKGTLATATNS